MVNLNIKPGILFVIAQFVCIGVSSNVLCLAFLKQHTPGLNCPFRKENFRAWGCGSVVEYVRPCIPSPVPQEAGHAYVMESSF